MFSSCKMISLITNEEFIMKNSECDFEMIDNRIYLNALVDGHQEKLIFDLGSSSNVILDTSLVSEYYKKKKFNNFFKSKLADGSKVKITYFPVNLETELFKFNNNLVSGLFSNFDNNCNKLKLKGIVGVGFIGKLNDKTIGINFDNNQLKVINNDELFDVLKDYNEVKSKFKRKHFNIYLTIGNKEAPFLFDTGNPIELLIHTNDIEIINYDEKTNYIGSPFGTAVDLMKQNSTFYDNVDVKFNNETVKANVSMILIDGAKYNNVGMDFIKNYNWIIDYKNKKVYYQKNKQEYEKMKALDYRYLFYVKENKILIASKLKAELKYNIGDEVTSVNGMEVNDENICELHKLLMDNNKNLDNVKLEVNKKY